MTAQRTATRLSVRYRLITGGAVLAAILVGVWTLPLAAWLAGAKSWIALYPALGTTASLAALALGTVLLIPGSVLAISTGYLFGMTAGVFVALTGTTLGACLAFLAGRSFARPLIADVIAGSHRFGALDSALGQRGFSLVILTRLSLLLPFNLLNYAFGLTRISLRDYASGTLVGMVPAITLYVYIGTLAKSVEDIVTGDLDGGISGTAITVIGVIALALAVYVINRTATAELKKYMPEDDN